MPLFPPLNFCMVAEDLYRSAIPNELNFQFLQTLNIKTMLVLQSSQDLDMKFFCFAEDSDITVISIDSDTSDTMNMPQWAPIAEESVVRALEVLMYSPNYPILVACTHGRALTGTVIGCLRKLQRWSLTSIFEEYRRYATTRGEQRHERFIELFDTDLVTLSENSPDFLAPFVLSSEANSVDLYNKDVSEV